MSTPVSRRSALRRIAGTASAAAVGALAPAPLRAGTRDELNGNINHAVVRWPYSDHSLEELAAASQEMGLKGIDYLPPDAWSTLEKYDLICTMAQGPEGTNTSTGFNQIENHEWLVPGYNERIRETAEAGYPNVIAFSGNRQGLNDEEGLANCLEGIKQIMPAAEKHGITVCMELLNSKVDHPGYQCDTTAWGMELVDRVGSDNFKLLHDIYHVQIMEGDIIRTIRDYSDYFAHYHTAGVPGRNEIDDSQELYYPAIMNAIVDTGFDGYVAQEFVPTREPLESLREAVQICDV